MLSCTARGAGATMLRAASTAFSTPSVEFCLLRHAASHLPAANRGTPVRAGKKREDSLNWVSSDNRKDVTRVLELAEMVTQGATLCGFNSWLIIGVVGNSSYCFANKLSIHIN